MNISMDQIQQARERQDSIDALDDREYIKTICGIVTQMINNPATRNLDFSEARNLCKQFAEAIEVQLESQASNITEPDEDEITYNDDAYTAESFIRQNRKPTLSEAKKFLNKKGYTLKG